MLQLITHNGLPRSQGGLMLGYMFERPDGSKGVWPPQLAAAPTQPTNRKSVLEQLNAEPVSAGIRVVRSAFGRAYCPVCDKRIGSYMGEDVPLGEHRCNNCGTLINVRGY